MLQKNGYFPYKIHVFTVYCRLRPASEVRVKYLVNKVNGMSEIIIFGHLACRTIDSTVTVTQYFICKNISLR